MTRDERLIKLALKIAEKSQHKFRIGAVIAVGNRIMSVGINKWRTHPRQINCHTNNMANSIHAELDAIISGHCMEGATIYVARILKNGAAGLAKPCLICQGIIDSAKIKRVVYTTSYGIEEL